MPYVNLAHAGRIHYAERGDKRDGRPSALLLGHRLEVHAAGLELEAGDLAVDLDGNRVDLGRERVGVAGNEVCRATGRGRAGRSPPNTLGG